MRLKLKNFRCYLDKEFDFGNEGMLLLSGPSGSGKTTILQAINFVLFGTGTKLTTFGKTSCRVELTFDELRIVRTKRPNRVVVTNLRSNEEYEDAAGQSVIDERFGTAFDVTSYVQQNAYKSFIMMSPLEKLGFLEKFAFNGIDLTKIKARCQAIIKKRNEALITTTSQLEMAGEHLDQLTKPQKVSFPLRNTKNKERSMKNEMIRFKNSKKLINRVQKKLDKVRNEQSDLKLLTVKQQAHQTEIDRLEEKLETLQLERSTTHYEGDEKLCEYEDLLVSVLARRELSVLQNKYEQDRERLREMETSEINNMKEEIENIKSKLWQDYTEEDTKETINEYKQVIKDSERYERLKYSLERYEVNEDKLDKSRVELEDLRKKLTERKERLSKLLLQQELYTCPSCQVQLRIQNDELHIHNDEISEDEEDSNDVRKDIVKLNRVVNRLEYQIPEQQNKLDRYKEIKVEIDELESQYEEEIPCKVDAEYTIEYLSEYKRSQYELEKKIKRLQTNIKDKIYSASFVMLQNGLTKQRKKIKSLKKQLKRDDSPDVDEQELRQTIEIQRRNKEKIHDYDKRIKSMKRELKEHRQNVICNEDEYKENYSEIRDKEDIELDINNLQEEKVTLEKKCEKHGQNIIKIDKYKRYREELARYREWVDKVEKLKEEENDKRSRYAAAIMLKDKILQAESIAILNVINSINTHAQEYLDTFFPTDPIVARLLPFKKTKKKTKPQINLQIDYKGMEADANMLSGGELARVVLAYTLALAEIFNTPLLLLDECTASIDQDLTGAVIEGIRNNFGNKMVIVIAHQVVSGIFDRVMKM